MTLLKKAAGAFVWSAMLLILLAGCERHHSSSRSLSPIDPTNPTDPTEAIIPYNPGTVIPNYGPVMVGKKVIVVMPLDLKVDPASISVYFGDVDAGVMGLPASDVIMKEETPWFLTCVVPPAFNGKKGVVDLTIVSPVPSSGVGTEDLSFLSSVSLLDAYTYIDPLSTVEFQARERFASGPVADLIPSDFDGDGWTDLIGRNTEQNALHFIRNDGGSGFLDPEALVLPPAAPGAIYEGLLSGDLNLDGLDDLVAFGRYGFLVLEKTGETSISYDETLINSGRFGTTGVLKDLNKDGFPDLALAGQGAVRIFYYDEATGGLPGTPSLLLESGPGVLDMAAADVNGDSLEDIVTVGLNRMVWYIGVGENEYQMRFPITFEPIAGPQGIVKLLCEDLNSDGAFDAVIASAKEEESGLPSPLGRLGVALADGLGGFIPPEFEAIASVPRGLSGATALLASDVDHDTLVDVVICVAGSNSLVVYRGDGAGGLLADRRYGVGDPPLGLAVFDADNDEVLDFAVAESERGSISMLRGSPGYPGMFRLEFLQSGVDIDLNSYPTRVLAAQLDADKLVDLLVLDKVLGGISTLLNDGAGGFVESTPFPVPGIDPISYCLLQANSEVDRFPDLAVIASEDPDKAGRLTLYLNDGEAGFVEQQVENTLAGPRDVRAADVNNDGFVDLVVIHGEDDQSRFYYGDGKGTIQTTALSSAMTGVNDLYLNDLDNDFDVDGVATAPDEHALYVLPTRSDAPLDPASEGASVIALPYEPAGLALADFSLDQFIDIAVSFEKESKLSLYYNDKADGFDLIETIDLPGYASRIESADLDFDHAPELIAALPDQSGIELLVNRNGELVRLKDKPIAINRFLARARPLWTDFNGDLLPELVMPSVSEKKITILFNRSE